MHLNSQNVNLYSIFQEAFGLLFFVIMNKQREGDFMKSKVYFSKTITPESVIELYKKLEKELPGKVAVKVHSGEQGNQTFCDLTFGRQWFIMLMDM